MEDARRAGESGNVEVLVPLGRAGGWEAGILKGVRAVGTSPPLIPPTAASLERRVGPNYG